MFTNEFEKNSAPDPAANAGKITPFFKPAIQKQDLPGDAPEPPAARFVTPDSKGITNSKDPSIGLNVHIDYLPNNAHLHIFIATEQGGAYKPGAPRQIIGDPGKGGDYTITLSPVPSHFFVRFEARSDKTNINIPGVQGTWSYNL